jgi:hypothetical protein
VGYKSGSSSGGHWVTGFLLVPRLVGMDQSVPDMVVAIGEVRGSVKVEGQNQSVNKQGVLVEGIPSRGKERRATDTGTSRLQRCKG